MAATVGEIAAGPGDGGDRQRRRDESRRRTSRSASRTTQRTTASISCDRRSRPSSTAAPGPVLVGGRLRLAPRHAGEPAALAASAVWVGGRSDDTLEIAATLADGWNGWAGTPERFAQDAGNVLEMAGDRPLELSWGGLLVLRASDAEAESALEGGAPGDRVVGGPGHRGSPPAGLHRCRGASPDPDVRRDGGTRTSSGSSPKRSSPNLHIPPGGIS